MSRTKKVPDDVCPECGATLQVDGCRLCPMLADGTPSNGTPTTGWPMVSEALAVNPRDVGRANARAKRHGIRVEYDAKGFAHIPDRNERRKMLKLEGFHDKESFTGY